MNPESEEKSIILPLIDKSDLELNREAPNPLITDDEVLAEIRERFLRTLNILYWHFYEEG
jgi:hypothetical protein